MNRIPQTQARLQPYINLYTIKGGSQLQTPADILTIVQSGEGIEQLGAIQKIGITQTRNTHPWRELNADIYGKIIEVYPDLPNYSLTLTRMVLYQENVLEAFGFDGSDLIYQYKPFIIVITLMAPDHLLSDGTAKPVTWIYHNCWFENFNMSFDIGAGDLRMDQDVNVATAGVISSSTPPPIKA